ncbi:MAG TPA: hypothetical protein VMO20_08330 [Candidatus Acidoferrum sp.]|nr:hypothetical protein [Candidatus Acidoferrum sp.]
MTKFCATRSSLLLTLLLPAIGCHKEQVQVYQVSQDQDQPQQTAAAPATNAIAAGLPPGHPDLSSMQSMPAGVVAPDTSAAPVTWTTPSGWTQVPPSEMRVGSFKITSADGKQADVSIVPLPGMAGGDFANVNRWRGQIGLQPAPDDELQNAAENVQAGGQPAQLYDITGVNPDNGRVSRILGVIQHRDVTAWFFKMTGDSGLVEQQKPAFIDFLKSLSFSSQQVQALPPGHPDIGNMSAQGQQALPPGHPAIGDLTATAAGPISHEGQPQWTVPSDWQEAPAGSFLIAKFTIPGANSATATVNVSQSAGDGGGLMPNVNRWRGQLGLPPANDALAITYNFPGGQGQVVTLNGADVQTGQPAEIQAAIITLSDRTWFYKLMGDPNVVNAHKEEFITFVKGAKY